MPYNVYLTAFYRCPECREFLHRNYIHPLYSIRAIIADLNVKKLNIDELEDGGLPHLEVVDSKLNTTDEDAVQPCEELTTGGTEGTILSNEITPPSTMTSAVTPLDLTTRPPTGRQETQTRIAVNSHRRYNLMPEASFSQPRSTAHHANQARRQPCSQESARFYNFTAYRRLVSSTATVSSLQRQLSLLEAGVARVRQSCANNQLYNQAVEDNITNLRLAMIDRRNSTAKLLDDASQLSHKLDTNNVLEKHQL